MGIAIVGTAVAVIAGLGLSTASAGYAYGDPAGRAEGVVLGADTPGAVPNRYIVTLKDQRAPSNDRARTLADAYGGTVRFTYSHALKGFSIDISEPEARRLAADPAVRSVEQVGTARIAGTQTDPPWGLDRTDQRDLPLDARYTYPDGGDGVTVYVLDTGARMSHQDFRDRISAGPDFIDDDSSPSDCHGHGTHVAGSAAGTTYGIAKNARIVPIRVLDCQGSGPWDVILAGIDWVTGNAQKPAVANMSLGGTGSQSAVESAVRRSISSGVTYALAAGNNGSDACGFTPARVTEAITVGNSTRTDDRYTGAGASNYGRCLDLFGPGTSIVSASHLSDTGTATMTGTSMASPHVAGAAALYLAANSGATPQQVRDALVTNGSTDRLGNVGTGSPNVLLYTGFLNGGEPGGPSVTDPGDQTTRVSTPVNLQLRASGGTTPYTWNASGLPAGLSIAASTGLISGTPTTAGTHDVTVTVTDAARKSATASFRWTISTDGGGCGEHEFTVNGTLTANQSTYQPGGRYYQSTAAGAHRADLCGPSGTDFDLYLQKWNGSAWAVVAQGITPGNNESIQYTGTPGYYRYRVHAYSGSGGYILGYTNP